ncbi:hypothetical protein ASPCADRAFT_203263 [Aspergillus carbonarius ITEM 5010]|uniref:Inhibitor I9 domain-containing protein n=1 Tax=Aspergillus carbonarius (strain ITEM 5010) TaxID=602072 RepID=A0A1R3RYA1_ASPC5|nr:hypothetical protein ASPCADRAFT_203263 [Aspergillus carbonarius ITEM 5010]
MFRYSITTRPGAPAGEIEKAKTHATKNKGKIVAEPFVLKGGFIVDYPEEQVDIHEVSDHLHIEQNHEFKTQ